MTRLRKNLPEAIAAAGLMALVVSIGSIYTPAGGIALGLALLAVGVGLARGQAPGD